MQWRKLVLFCAVLCSALAEPEPKKYKAEPKENTKDSSLTVEERSFLREVETKFGIKSDVPLPSKENSKDDEANVEKQIKKTLSAAVPGFPAVIAIEIVNDTDTKTKGKRTIDANLGYGYRTNNGYMYTYFGRPSQDKGKFMIYPYSQKDIPPTRTSHYKDSNAEYSHTSASRNRHGSQSAVEIQPSQAFELVPVKEGEDTSGTHQYNKHETEPNSNYDNVKALESPPPPYPSSHNSYTSQASASPSTLYTTYNGQQFSGLQGKFPMVMSNYLVDPSQLLQNPEYQSAGLTQDHLRTQGQQLQQRVVPVLVLRIPSSYLKNPSAELYANLPQNYPLSQYLNNVNLQALVNQYFKKIGFPYAPQIMAYPNGATHEQPQQHPASPASQYEPQHYANPYVRPAYTQADYSGVQYSAVQPVMAKYPTQAYLKQQYYMARPQPQRQPHYEQLNHQQQYEHQYQYVQHPASQPPQPPQTSRYTVEQQYETAQYQTPYTTSYEAQDENTRAEVQNTSQDVSGSAEQEISQEITSQEEPKTSSAEYEHPHLQQTNQNFVALNNAAQYERKPDYTEYGPPADVNTESHQSNQQETHTYQSPQVPTSSAYEFAKQKQQQQHYLHYAKKLLQTQQDAHRHQVQKETIAIYPSYSRNVSPKYSAHQYSTSDQRYVYQNTANSEPETQTVDISENYPSKDHTHAVPYRYSKPARPSSPVQTVNYVTPLPYSAAKYQTQYKVMVPQTALKNDEKISYVNSHSLPMHFLQGGLSPEYNSEEEYTASPQYGAPDSSQKAPLYHSYPKRMTKSNENKADNTKKEKKESPEKSDQKKST